MDQVWVPLEHDCGRCGRRWFPLRVALDPATATVGDLCNALADWQLRLIDGWRREHLAAEVGSRSIVRSSDDDDEHFQGETSHQRGNGGRDGRGGGREAGAGGGQRRPS